MQASSRGEEQKEEAVSQPKDSMRDQSSYEDKIVVTGFPNFTHPKDLIRVFSKYGWVNIETLTLNYAVLKFDSAECAQAALRANGSLKLYGSLFNIKKYSPKLHFPKQNKHEKRLFPKTKQKEVVKPPDELVLEGDLYSQTDTILSNIRLNHEEVTKLSALYLDLEKALDELWPGCVAMPFGSITTGLGIKTSDADCFVDIPLQWRHQNVVYVNKAKKRLQLYPTIFTEILAIPRANTPIVKFFHIPTNTNCDVSFKTPLGVQNSKLITYFLHFDPKLLPVAVLIKYWSKVHGISGSGKLSNYTVTMLFLFYLQQPPISLLPSVESLQRDRTFDCIVDNWNTGFKRQLTPPKLATLSMPEILGGFFEYYSKFNFEDYVVCPYLGHPIEKKSFHDLGALPEEFARYKNNVLSEFSLPLNCKPAFCVQDPFELCHNIASCISTRVGSVILEFFKFAAAAFASEKTNNNNYENFLKKILLEKPILPKPEGIPECKIKMFSRVLDRLGDDWFTKYRKVCFIIFEDLLNLKLTKVESEATKNKPKTKKFETELYQTSLNRAIWKRKKFFNVYKHMKLTFIARETRISQEILRLDHDEIHLDLNVKLTYSVQKKNVTLAVQFVDGDAELFKDFARFFHSCMHNWVTNTMLIFEDVEESPSGVSITEENIKNNTATTEGSDSEEDSKENDFKSDKNSDENIDVDTNQTDDTSS